MIKAITMSRPKLRARQAAGCFLIILAAIFYNRLAERVTIVSSQVLSNVASGSILHLKHFVPVPPVSEEMSKVLSNVGLSMTEGYYWHSRSDPINSTVMTLFPGLSRLCHNEIYMRYVLNRCIQGLTSMVFTLQSQWSHTGPKPTDAEDSFDLCIDNIKRMTRGTNCTVLVARQAFIKRREPFSCGNIVANRPIVRMQTLAVGRAYNWATYFFPPHKYYIRARLDGPWCIPSNIPTKQFIALNHVKYLTDGNKTSLFPSDRYALVPSSLAGVYFHAWKVWLSVDCNDFCLAGAGNRTANLMGWKSGECPLSAHMNTYHNHFAWKAVAGVGEPIARSLNTTHVFYYSENSSLTYEEMLREREAVERRCAITDEKWFRDVRIASNRK